MRLQLMDVLAGDTTMNPLRNSLCLAAAALVMAASPAHAGWDNVFQVTCWGCKSRPSTSGYYSGYYYVPPAATSYYYPAPVASYYAAPVQAYSSPCDTCQQPVQQCTTKYVQRCYYQPVTTYTTKTFYEPVTTYTTKTYYEPVTTYRYSCYYDPCSCSYQQVATPCTSYQARQQSCPVQSWVQRCSQVPVTSYQQVNYWEPQTSCCSTPCAAPCQQPCAQPQQQQPCAPQQQQPLVPQPSQSYSPGLGGTVPQTVAPPTVQEKQGTGQYYQQQQGSEQSLNRQVSPNGKLLSPAPSAPRPIQPPPGVKLDRIASNSGPAIQGQVVGDRNAPKAGVQVIFVSAKRQAPEKTVTSNVAGQFEVELPAGDWLVYLRSADGQQVYHSKFTVEGSQRAPIMLVSR
jgi:hypothetical protein